MTNNPKHPTVTAVTGDWRQWLPRPPAPTTVAGLQKKLSDLSVQRVGVRERIAATRNHQTVEQYRTQTRRDAALRKIGTLLEVTASPRARKSRGATEADLAARYGVSIAEWRASTRR
jgi:hypothetical protein